MVHSDFVEVFLGAPEWNYLYHLQVSADVFFFNFVPSMISFSVLGSRSFLGTPCITSPYLRFLILTPLNTRFQSISLSSCGSSFDSNFTVKSVFVV